MSQQKNERPLPLILVDLMSGMMVSQALNVVVNLGIADLLKDGEKTIKELAQLTDSNEDFLYRVLRALAGFGIFAETEKHHFQQTQISYFLRSDVAGSMHNFIKMWGADWRWKSWGALLDSVKSGSPGFNLTHKEANIWDYFTNIDLESGKVFSLAMSNFANTLNPAIVPSYDFSSFEKVVDVGGAHGNLLVEVLKANPTLKGVLFDRPSVVEDAKAFIDSSSVVDRCEIIGGDFLTSVPVEADLYMMKFVLHDWSDQDSIKILSNCRKHINPNGKVLIIEQLIAPGNEPSFSKMLDLEMMVCTHYGRERTEDDFKAIYEAAGFKLNRIIKTPTIANIIEGVVA